MPSWITLALGIVNKLLGLLGLWKAEVHDVEKENDGKNEVAAEGAVHIEEARRERDLLDREIATRTDSQLHADLDKWMRD